MAALPKPPGQRVRQGTRQAHWRTLPAAEPFKPPPADRGWLKSTRSWWSTLWASPMASTYLEADLPALVRLGEMVDAGARGALGAVEISQAQQSTPLRPRALANFAKRHALGK